MKLTAAEEVLDFWFGRPDEPHHLQTRPEWFRKDDAFDATIRERFGALIDAALRGELAGWASSRATHGAAPPACSPAMRAR